MKKIKSQKGQALILVAFAMVGLIAFTALAIDGGRVYADRRHAQNTADTAALAAALAKIQNNANYKNVGIARATSNGYTDGVNQAQVAINLCNEAGVTCQGLPNGANPAEYIRVKITSVVNTTFAKVIGRDKLTNTVEAVTRVQGSTSSGSFFNGAGLVSTKSDNSNQCFLLNGGANVTLHDTGIFVNCTGAQSIFANGNSNMTMGADSNTAGCFYNQGGNITGGNINCNQDQETVSASTFANVPTALPTPTCSTPGTQSGNTLSPGLFTSGVNANYTMTLNPGTYCFNGGLNLNGQAQLIGTGAIRIVLGNNSLNLTNAVSFDDVEIYENNGTVSIKSDFTANRLRFFATGTGGLDVQNGTLSSGNAYFYSYRGLISWNAQSTVNLHTPPDGDTFHGLLVYLPWGNTNAYILNGGTNSVITGTLLMPTSDVTYNGGAGFELHGQVIGQTFKVNGDAVLDLWFTASENYDPGSDPTIEFTQ